MSKKLVPVEVKDLLPGQKFYVEFVYDGKINDGMGLNRVYAVPQDYSKTFSKFHDDAGVFVYEETEPNEKN